MVSSIKKIRVKSIEQQKVKAASFLVDYMRFKQHYSGKVLNRKVMYSTIRRFNGITYHMSLVREDGFIRLEAFGIDKWSIIEPRDISNSEFKQWQYNLSDLFKQIKIHDYVFVLPDEPEDGNKIGDMFKDPLSQSRDSLEDKDKPKSTHTASDSIVMPNMH